MKKFDEYIIPINETAKDYDEMFVGVIRRQPVLTRCKDCKHHIDEEPGVVYCPIIVGGWIEEEFYCSWAERKEE